MLDHGANIITNLMEPTRSFLIHMFSCVPLGVYFKQFDNSDFGVVSLEGYFIPSLLVFLGG